MIFVCHLHLDGYVSLLKNKAFADSFSHLRSIETWVF
jgi:hypothetical protein